MKNLKEYINEGIFDIDDNIDNVDESVKNQIEQFLKDNFDEASSCKISNEPNVDGKYEVSSLRDIKVKNKKIASLTNGLFIWTNISGEFNCTRCDSLQSLEGAPEKVSGNFECIHCSSLTSLKGAPKEVGRDFDCSSCKSLISLEGAPKEVGRDFYCGLCDSLQSLKGAPNKVGKDFYCSHCSLLTSLKGSPKKVGGDFYCTGCGTQFSEEDIKKVSNIKGSMYN